MHWVFLLSLLELWTSTFYQTLAIENPKKDLRALPTGAILDKRE